MRYKAVCENEHCEWKGTSFSYIDKETAQHFAEIHMMQTGHIVDVKEVY